MSKPGTSRGGPQEIPRPAEWRHLESSGWIPSEPFTTALIAEALANYTPSELLRGPAVDRPEKQGRRSAVLVALYDGVDGPTTILTRRPKHMRKHAGEIAFPGGAHDDTDESLWHTALREAEEEVALDPTLPRRLGELDRFVTGASFSLVQPIVAALDDEPTLTASPDEVDRILHVPLIELMSTDVYRAEEWLFNGQWQAMHFFDIQGETIWGATSLMIQNLISLLGTSP